MKSPTASETPLRVLYVGRLSPEKGVDILLRAWALLDHQVVTASLTIVGDGPERPALEALAAELSISDQVAFTGALPRADALARLSSASLLVLSSICYETFGLAVLEAASLGVPSIVANIGGQASLVKDGITGRLVPPGDPTSLASALRELLSDPDGLRRMGEAARTAFEASDCVPSRNLKRLLDIYNV